MEEHKSRSIWPTAEPFIPPKERALKSVRQSAHYCNLDEPTTQALLRFATTCYRIREIKVAFDGTTTERVLYQMPPDEDEMPRFEIVTREDFRDRLKNLRLQALENQIQNLNVSDEVRSAVHSAQRAIEDALPSTFLNDVLDETIA